MEQVVTMMWRNARWRCRRHFNLNFRSHCHTINVIKTIIWSSKIVGTLRRQCRQNCDFAIDVTTKSKRTANDIPCIQEVKQCRNAVCQSMEIESCHCWGAVLLDIITALFFFFHFLLFWVTFWMWIYIMLARNMYQAKCTKWMMMIDWLDY